LFTASHISPSQL